MNRIVMSVSGAADTPGGCVKLNPGTNYSDSIIKGFDYQDVNQTTVSVINHCSVPFTIPGFVLFSDTSNGGNFTASVMDINIGPNQTLNVPVIYDGIYLGNNLSPNYPIAFNGNNAVFSLIITVPVVNSPPVVTDMIFELQPNIMTKVLTIADFLAHFTDIDNDQLAAVIIEGNTQNYKLNGGPVTSGAQIPRALIESGYLVFHRPNTNDYNEDAVIWKAVDSAGSVSL